jgi:hypothetical protein
VPVGLRPAAATARLQLYNAVGQLVLEQPGQLTAQGELQVRAPQLPAGLYTLRLKLGTSISCHKIMLQ